MSKIGKMGFYADEKCNIPLGIIEWDGGFMIKLQSGKEEKLPNTAVAGSIAVATFYVRNEGRYRFAVTSLSHSDERVKTRIDKDWLKPNIPVRLVISYKVPNSLTSESFIKRGIIKIEGYYILGDE